MSELRVGSLCTGYGGLDEAVLQAAGGGVLAWVADNDPGAAAILAHRYPQVPNLGDITAVDWAGVPRVDILCAGFPCQDVSQAGARAGLHKGTRTGIWLTIVDAVRMLAPRLIVIENVRGLLTARGDEPAPVHLRAEAAARAAASLLEWLGRQENLARAKGDMNRVHLYRARTARLLGSQRRLLAQCQWHERRLVRAIGTVLGSLASLGYDARWAVVSASDAGAPHRRERVFILVWLADAAGHRRPSETECVPGSGPAADRQGQADGPARAGGTGAAENADRATGGQRRIPAPGQTPGGRPRADAGRPGGAPAAADAERDGQPGRSPEGARAADARRPGPRAEAAGRGADAPADAEFPTQARLGEPGSLVSATRLPGSGRCGGGNERPEAPADWGPYEPAIRRWESILGRPAPRPTEPGRTGERLSPAFVEWLMGLPPGWVTDVPGLPRNAQLRALGNGVVPQQAALALGLLGLRELLAAARE